MELVPLSPRFLTSVTERDRWIGGDPQRWTRWWADLAAYVRAADPDYRAFVEWTSMQPRYRKRLPPVITTYKDLIDVVPFATRLGNAAGYRHYPVRSALAARYLARRNFVCVGKVVTTEFGIGTRASSVNPRFPEWSPSGSSTGCAVAVAAGFCDVSIGTDSGGSIRYPAGNCGVVGLRLTPRPDLLEGIFPVSPRMDSIGVITRTVEDLAYLWAERRLSGLGVGQRAGSASVRIGVVADWEDAGCHPTIQKGFEALLTMLGDSGTALPRIPLAWFRYREAAWALLSREVYDVHRTFQISARVEYEPGTWEAILLGRDVSDQQYEALKRDQQAAVALAHRDLAEGGIDVLLSPLDAHLPRHLSVAPPTGTIPRHDKHADESRYASGLGFAELASFARLPAIALPASASKEGVPLALQLMARAGGESDLIQAGLTIERIMGALRAE